MRQTLIRWLWQALRPSVQKWLNERALRLPRAQQEAIAHRFQVPAELVEQLENALRQIVLYQLERWEP
ncbi:MAG: hypothetical protein N2045_00470 [Fimbriimonadales bacterium]|jgi:hypothetical protein|nr:hypothetical protein [Fimbriimonadales bacterium]GIV12435.1 MAG: hypothetical protein KatS3mg021_0717 [Fimbriimonadales bacterium]CUU11357.1 hypothetical protein GBSOP10_11134 [Armatimonadetes bacterium GBS]CUU33858.1 hypothetical protein GXSOP10_108101 [Armatimonadetes bacterium GXS]